MKIIERLIKRPLSYRIDKNDEKILYQVMGIMYLLVLVIVALVIFKIEFNTISDIDTQAETIDYVVNTLTTSTIIYIILLLIFYKPLMKVRNIQKLAELIFSSQYYINPQITSPTKKKINNIFDLFDFGDLVRNRQNFKTLYFPKFYIDQRKGQIRIYVYLDGSRFQAEFTELNEKLELVYDKRIVVDKYIENEHQVYILKSFDEKERINFENSDEDNYSIRFMNNMYWNFRKEPHGLITGGTGSGKTYLLYYVIKEILRKGHNLKIIDPKNSDLSQFGRIDENMVASNKEEIIEAIKEANDEMENRYAYMNTYTDKFGEDFKSYNMSAYFLVIDEYLAFNSTLDTKEKKEVDGLIKNLVLKGRQAGVNLIFTTQRPDANVIDGAIRDQLHFRLGLGKMSKDGYRMLFPEENSSFQELDTVGYGYSKIIGQDKIVKVFLSPMISKPQEVYKEIVRLIKERKECQ